MMRATDDIIAIQQLLAAYVFAIDAKDYDALDAVFLPGATVDYRAAGGATGKWPTIKAWLEAALAPFSLTQHLIGLPLIRLDGDRASARTMLFNPMRPARSSNDALFFVGCTYLDDLVRTSDGWRIAKRVEQDFWAKDAPADLEPAA
ncbi:nuclear transport factor 2 family protein [Sphingopyxis sp. DBS4]|uniref:nuclear transport factor 2 family protein n=1 Tax=Sphingopyxis sp. DBS4 TaxID=2968500 RepID=UPI00214B968F|nr:nuclear transport factor 2 family protein [Sphingopyxis sp. DBS4]